MSDERDEIRTAHQLGQAVDMTSDDPQARRAPVLGDHKKVGKRFVPPMIARLNFTELSYVRDLVPEITWIALANRRLGYAGGTALCSDVAKLAKGSRREEKFSNFALLSCYSDLDEEEVRTLVSTVDAAGLLPTLREVVEPLTELFAECPMGFVGRPSCPRERLDLVNELRDCVGQLLDRMSTEAAAAQATVLYTRRLTGGLFYVGDALPPDLNAIVDAPGTEAAEHAAAIVRATVLQELMPREEGDVPGWPRYFWNNALHIDTCQFPSESQDG